MRPQYTLDCPHCDTPFEAKRKEQRFCSPACGYAARHRSLPSRQQFVRVCACGCGQPTLLSKVTRGDRGHVFGQPLAVLYGHRSHRRLTYKERGYVYVYAPDHPAAKEGYVREHRIVVERALGRLLLPTEHIHHRNGQRDDNRLENLQVLSGREHRLLHIRQAASHP